MPYRPMKPCAHHGCPELVNSRYCSEHTKAAEKHYNLHVRDRERDKYYGGSWKKIRAAFLSAHPLCELCRDEGRLNPATIVHHKMKLTDGGANDWDNLQALCSECHSRLHAKRGDYF